VLGDRCWSPDYVNGFILNEERLMETFVMQLIIALVTAVVTQALTGAPCGMF
jgi:hypothetical protein